MRSKGSRQSKMKRYIAVPKKFLDKAREFYVKRLIEFDGRIVESSSMMIALAMPFSQVSHMPKDFVTCLKKPFKICEKSKDQFYGSLYSKINYGNNHYEKNDSRGDAFDGMFRSYSFAIGRMGRIDEDEPCYFREEEIIMKSEILLPTFRR